MKNLDQQYQNELNLQKRIQIHQFGTATESWYEFLTKHIVFTDNCRILEIGCGTGLLWKHLLKKRPTIKQIILSDFSQGMIENAKNNLEEFEKDYDVQYKKINVSNITYENECFDVVIANHILYHIPDSEKALSEIHRVLNKGGVFYASTIGKNNMNEIKLIIEKYFPNVENDLFFNSFLENFSLENALEKTKVFFKQSERTDYKDHLSIPSPKPIREYIESFNFPHILDTDENKSDFENLLTKDYNFTNGFYVSKEIGLIRCEK